MNLFTTLESKHYSHFVKYMEKYHKLTLDYRRECIWDESYYRFAEFNGKFPSFYVYSGPLSQLKGIFGDDARDFLTNYLYDTFYVEINSSDRYGK